MRALIVLLALATTPFLAGVSQDQPGSPRRTLRANNGVGHDAAHCTMRAGLHPEKEVINKCPPPGGTGGDPGSGGTGGDPGSGGTGGDPGSGGTGGDPGSGGTGGGGGTCAVSAPGTGTATIRGQVFVDDPAQNYPYLEGWCVELRDVNGTVVATTASTSALNLVDTDGNNFLFTGVEGGTYTVCEVFPPPPSFATWRQSSPGLGPVCGANPDGTTRYGYTAPVMAGADASYNWFGNLP